MEPEELLPEEIQPSTEAMLRKIIVATELSFTWASGDFKFAASARGVEHDMKRQRPAEGSGPDGSFHNSQGARTGLQYEQDLALHRRSIDILNSLHDLKRANPQLADLVPARPGFITMKPLEVLDGTERCTCCGWPLERRNALGKEMKGWLKLGQVLVQACPQPS